MNKSDKWYGTRLQKFFDLNYGAFEDIAEFHINPAPNRWRFVIPGMGEVNLICDDNGIVKERRNE